MIKLLSQVSNIYNSLLFSAVSFLNTAKKRRLFLPVTDLKHLIKYPLRFSALYAVISDNLKPHFMNKEKETLSRSESVREGESTQSTRSHRETQEDRDRRYDEQRERDRQFRQGVKEREEQWQKEVRERERQREDEERRR
jgi:hypothetical protein